jgi:hypothetical protein
MVLTTEINVCSLKFFPASFIRNILLHKEECKEHEVNPDFYLVELDQIIDNEIKTNGTKYFGKLIYKLATMFEFHGFMPGIILIEKLIMWRVFSLRFSIAADVGILEEEYNEWIFDEKVDAGVLEEVPFTNPVVQYWNNGVQQFFKDGRLPEAIVKEMKIQAAHWFDHEEIHITINDDEAEDEF